MNQKGNVFLFDDYVCTHEFDPTDIFQNEERCYKCGVVREVFSLSDLFEKEGTIASSFITSTPIVIPIVQNKKASTQEYDTLDEFVNDKIDLLRKRHKRLTSLF